jgi:outer membrane lipoprotein-sorting protein
LKYYLAKLLLIFIIILFSLEGCIPAKPTEEIEILPSERLINKLEVNRRRIKTFEGNGTLTINSKELNNSAAFRVILSKPDSIYLTIMGPFGIELAQALVTQNDFIFYDALNNTAYEGEINDEVLHEIFKINLPFTDLIDAFVGSVNLTENLYKNPDEYAVIYDQYVLTYIDSITNVSKMFKVDVRELGITDYQVVDNTGKKVLEGKYSDFNILETVAVPYRISVKNVRQNQTIVIEYRNMTANKSNTHIDFRIPSDASVIKW